MNVESSRQTTTAEPGCCPGPLLHTFGAFSHDIPTKRFRDPAAGFRSVP